MVEKAVLSRLFKTEEACKSGLQYTFDGYIYNGPGKSQLPHQLMTRVKQDVFVLHGKASPVL